MNSSTSTSNIELYHEVVSMRKALDGLYKKILKMLPAEEGTDLWWEKTTINGLDEYSKGKGKPYKFRFD